MEYQQQTKPYQKISLDIKDRKILTALSTNCRTPLSRIAKKVGLSRDAVEYRIKSYERQGIIQGYRTVINLTAWNFLNYHLFITLKNHSLQKENNFIKYLKKRKEVKAILNFGSRYDFEVALAVNNQEELSRIIEEINAHNKDYIQNIEIISVLKNYTSKALPESFYHQEKREDQERKEYKPDEKDKELLKALAEEARISLTSLAQKIRTSADTIAYRLKNLERSQYILGYVPIINFKSLGYNLYCLLLNIPQITHEEEEVLKQVVTNDKQILWAVKSLGKYTLLAYTLVSDIKELRTTTNALKDALKGKIKDIDILIGFEEYKYTYLPKGILD